MTFQSSLQTKIANTFKRLNTSGKNLGGRLALQYQIWDVTQAGTNPTKNTAVLTLVPASEIDLIPIDAKVGMVKRFDKDAGLSTYFGDASLEIAALDASGTALTQAQLMGKDLDSNQQARYLLGTELYTPVDANLNDDDGLTFRLVLKRVQA